MIEYYTYVDPCVFTAYVITCTKIGCCVLELIISIYNIYMYIYNIYVYIWHELNRVQFPVLVQVFNQCARSPDMRHKEMTIQERERKSRGRVVRTASNIFQQLFCSHV